jgi:hypothetical protein
VEIVKSKELRASTCHNLTLQVDVLARVTFHTTEVARVRKERVSRTQRDRHARLDPAVGKRATTDKVPMG